MSIHIVQIGRGEFLRRKSMNLGGCRGGKEGTGGVEVGGVELRDYENEMHLLKCPNHK